MSAHYQAVVWTPFKKRYDLALVAGIVAYLLLFVGISLLLHPTATLVVMMIRAFGTAAFVLLHVILAIGALSRLDRRWLPLLYNRRHLGVSMFVLAAIHGALVISFYHSGGVVNPLVSVLTTDAGLSFGAFPFQAFGFLALVILFVMAATSHDFWLANLTAPVWKALHMCVYVAYGMIVVHVAFGVLQAELDPLFFVLLAAGFVGITFLHLRAGFGERALDHDHGDAATAAAATAAVDNFVRACRVEEIPEKRARIVSIRGERVAVFRYDGKVSAVSNVCQHQNGPLGEGKIVDGCITCPWHGFQYYPDSGQAPPPFTERLPTFEVKLLDGDVYVGMDPLPAGTKVEPATFEIDEAVDRKAHADDTNRADPSLEIGE